MNRAPIYQGQAGLRQIRQNDGCSSFTGSCKDSWDPDNNRVRLMMMLTASDLSFARRLLVAGIAGVATMACAVHSRDNTTQTEVVEATIPDTLHVNDSAVTPADRAVAARVRATLALNPLLSVDTDRLFIHVQHGEVLLQGSVSTQAVKEEMSAKVPLIPGVMALENRLTVASRQGPTR